MGKSPTAKEALQLAQQHPSGQAIRQFIEDVDTRIVAAATGGETSVTVEVVSQQQRDAVFGHYTKLGYFFRESNSIPGTVTLKWGHQA